jgi:exportin-7
MDSSKIAQVEALCMALYQGKNDALRTEAQQQLLALQSSADFIPQCQFILDHSTQPYAQLVASSSLESLMTQFWNNFTVEQKVEIRNYILNYLATHATTLEDFVIGSVTKLVCRITKLGWFDSPEHRQIIEAVTKFLEATVDHYQIGLRVLFSLVDEMNSQTAGRSLTAHRKTAVSFRDQTLYQAFQISITTLKNLQAGVFTGLTARQEGNIAHYALALANQCLSFDFIGTNPEESAEDVGTVQVPSNWRPLIQDTATMQLLFDFYAKSTPPRSSLALQSLVQLSSVRRSLFASEKERAMFLQSLMTGIQQIVLTKKGLDHEDNYHEFCRLLGRLKASYQLSELVKINGFMEWLELACEFTIASLQNWQYSMNSVHYLLALWGRMVAALPYLRADGSDSQRQAQTLRQCVLRVTESYIKTMLDSVDVVIASDSGIDDPLDDEGSLKEQMDRLPVIAHMQYDTVAQYLLGLFEQALTLYDQALTVAPSPQVMKHMLIIEGRFTWLIYMVSSVIGAQASPDPKKPGDDMMWDGRLCRCVFQLIQVIDYRMTTTSGQGKCDSKLEVAVLNFFKSFKKSFMADGLSNSPLSMGAVVPGGITPHPLLSFALSYSGDKDTASEAASIYDAMGLGDVSHVMNAVVNKLCNNIKYWHRSDQILEETLEVFVELISNYSSSKTLLGLETVNFIVHNHTGQHFPFLGYDNDNKYRISFYAALSRLVFSSSEDLNNAFDSFIAPNIEIMAQLSQTTDLRQPAVRLAIVGALRDLRGITSATYNKRTYNLLFDALYPSSFPFLLRVAETWYDDPTVMTALLKFLQVRLPADIDDASALLMMVHLT